VIKKCYQDELKGLLSRKEAQKKAKDLVRSIRYGSDKKDYFWINDMQYKTIVHPYRPDHEGRDMSNLVDANGKYFIREFVKIIKEHGAGYGEYMWQWKDDPNLIVPKLSYVSGFKPWGWLVGTGVYYQDIDAEVSLLIKEQLKITLIILFIVFLLVSFSVWQSRQASLQLRKSKENLYVTLNSIGDAIIATDIKSKITMMNPVAAKLTGWEEEEALGKSIDEIFHLSNGDAINIVESSIEDSSNKQEEFIHHGNDILISRNNEQCHISSRSAPIKKRSGKIAGTVIVFNDITKQYELEDQLRQSQKMEAIGQLAGGISHDFNNMLAGIIGGAVILSEKIGENYNLTRHVDMIIEAAERASMLTSKLCDFSRKGKILSSPVDIHTSIKDTCIMLEHSVNRSIRIVTELNAKNSIVIGDHVQIQNIVLNLCLNARDAISGKGEIKISTETVELDSFFCQNSSFNVKPDSYVEISVSDNGSGIESKNLKKIFEPFFTTKNVGEGTGLGLSAVYGSVKDHNGDIHTYSELGKGSVFKIFLPLSKETIRIEKNKTEIKKGTGCVLVVDDEPIVQKMVEDMLHLLGYKTLVASNGKEGVEVYKKHGDKIDLVFLDMIMPEMNGHDVFYALMEINSDVKVLLASGFSFDTSISKIIKDGASDFIKKPFHYIELGKAIADILDKKTDKIDI
ncbi:MAG: cache domain-containing protein, partial [Alphaproteobacteria bacterium]|nr:cache domain-containing protein [Alphaproteobacteria bacterium]